MPRFLTELDGRWLDDKRFMLLSDLVYESDILKATLTVPKGFVTDFASVPRVPIAYWLFGDRAHHESVPHDFLYQTHKSSRADADKLFLEAMIVRKKPLYIRQPMYWGVVLGGASSYADGPERFEILNPSQP